MALKAEYLHAFSVAAKLGSISDAAKALGVSQPAISRQLSCLQKEAGRKLYKRSALGISLTTYGKELLIYANSVSKSLMAAKKFVERPADGNKMVLKLGISKHLVNSTTAPLLKKLRIYNSKEDRLRLDLTENYTHSLLEQILTDNLDAAYLLAVLEDIPNNINILSIAQERLSLFTLPDDPIAKMANENLAVIEGETLVVPNSVSKVSCLIMKSLKSSSIKPGRILEVSGPGAVRNAVIGGLGIGITLESYIAAEVKAGWLKYVDTGNKVLKLSQLLVTSKLNPPPLEKQEALEELIR